MALTEEQRKQILDAAYKAHREGKPLFPPKAKPNAAEKSDDELMAMEWADLTPQQQGRVMALLQDRLKPKPSAKPRSRSDDELLKIEWADMARAEQSRAMALQQMRLKPKPEAKPRNTDAELRAMEWSEMTEIERSDAMAMQQRRLTPPKPQTAQTAPPTVTQTREPSRPTSHTYAQAPRLFSTPLNLSIAAFLGSGAFLAGAIATASANGWVVTIGGLVGGGWLFLHGFLILETELTWARREKEIALMQLRQEYDSALEEQEGDEAPDAPASGTRVSRAPAPDTRPSEAERAKRVYEEVRESAAEALRVLIPHALASLRAAADSPERITAPSIAWYHRHARQDAIEERRLNYEDSRYDFVRAAAWSKHIEPHIAEYLQVRIEELDEVAYPAGRCHEPGDPSTATRR